MKEHEKNWQDSAQIFPTAENGAQMGIDPAAKPSEQVRHMIEAPEHCVFRRGEVLPMRGFNFEVLGYTSKFDLVLRGLGPTKKNAKRMRLG